MKVGFLTVCSLAFFGFFPATAQSVENVVAEARQNGKVAITYDLIGNPDTERFKVSVYSSYNGYAAPLKNISGDIATDYSLVPGKGKKIEWDAAAELGTYNGELAFEVRAEAYRFLRISKPAEGKSVRRGATTTLRWTGGHPTEKIKIELLKEGRVVSNIGEVGNSGTYDWPVPKEMVKGKGYTLRFTGSSSPVASGPFSIGARYPMALKVALPAAVVFGAIVLLKKGGDGGPLPVPPEPN
ncbi:MAG TPA: Ser-Thr-rich GPI-anchored membrane family protein [Cyclobacteriaceae bacterium]|nr:Ser-Thr-rich GPI-anchored membrane family protein [Cyclobacteriaceae bacterium]